MNNPQKIQALRYTSTAKLLGAHEASANIPTKSPKIKSATHTIILMNPYLVSVVIN
jgi:hypothetical protein